MPGSRTYMVGSSNRAVLKINGDLEVRKYTCREKVVYFTDQSPTFEFEIRNLTNDPLMVECVLFIAYQDKERMKTENFQIAISPEETESRDFGVDLLPYQGNVIIGLLGEFNNNSLRTSADYFTVFSDGQTASKIKQIRNDHGFVNHLVRSGSNEDPSTDDDDTASDTEIPLYTFQVFDREYYSVNHVWPRRAQYIAAGLSVIIILVGVLQLMS